MSLAPDMRRCLVEVLVYQWATSTSNEAIAADSNATVVISDRNPRDLLLEERGGTACVEHLAHRYPDSEVWWVPDVPDPKRVLVSLSDQPALPGIC